jgi:hypothetical protein
VEALCFSCEVWLPPKLLLVPAVPPTVSLDLTKDPCNSAFPHKGECILSPGDPEWEGT